jgi:2-methylcitrate dehydratase PrpD
MQSAHTPERVAAEFVFDLAFADVPADVVDTVERAFVDTVGVTLAGAATDAAEKAARLARIGAGTGDGGASLLGTSGRASLPEAALANGTAGHALDYDDLSWAMDGHPSVPLVAPILAVGEAVGASGSEAVTAFAAGFETECFFATPISPTHYERGWHPTATFGTFGATAAAASLLDLGVDATHRALAVAASMPAGVKRNFGAMTKPLHAGLAGRSGITAALLARDGFTADEVPISGDRGFFDLYGGGATETPTPPGNPWRLRTEGIHVKYYPCCYFTHTSITGTATLVERADLDPEEIERIEVSAARGADDALAHPDPETGLEAKFSMEHCVAAAAALDRVGLDAFEPEAVSDPTIAALRERVDFEPDPDREYDSHAAHLRLVTTDGDSFEREQADPPGVFESPLTADQLRQKYVECATRTLDRATADRTHDRLAALAEEPSVADVVADLAADET